MSATEELLDPKFWSMTIEEVTYPFVEDENANITGLGHQDPTEFAAAINRYDAQCNGEPYPEDEQWDERYISHLWAALDPDGERLDRVPEETPGAVAVTTLWGQR